MIKKSNFIETYNDWDIYENTDGKFFISGDYYKENITITEDTLEDMKLMIDYL